MNRATATLLALLSPMCVAAESGVPATVHSVVSGGYWQSGEQAGSYRVVIVNDGWEHVRSRVFVEWVQEPRARDMLPVVVSTVEPELPFGQASASLSATLKPVANGKVQVVLTGVKSVQPSQRVRAVLVATSPGRVAMLAANPSIERTASSGLRPPPAAAHVKR